LFRNGYFHIAAAAKLECFNSSLNAEAIFASKISMNLIINKYIIY